jgi:hypothetical protein
VTTFKFKPHRTLNLLTIIGKADATQLHFLSFCHCLGNAKTNQQMQLAREASTSIATADKRKVTKDSLIVVLAYNQRRFYVFLHVDPMKDAEQAKNINQDIWNEAPTAQDQLLGSEGQPHKQLRIPRLFCGPPCCILAMSLATPSMRDWRFFLKLSKGKPL